MTREEAFAVLLESGLSRRRASALLRVAKQAGSASGDGVTVGCHPRTRRFTVARYR
jgi:hypothetical protein